MAEIEVIRRSTGEADFTVYKVGGKTFSSYGQAQKYKETLDQQGAQQQQQQQQEQQQQTTQQQDQQQTTTTTTGLSGNSFTSPIDGKTYTVKDGLELATVYDQETRRFRVANPGEQGATRREGDSFIIDDSTGQIVSIVRTYNEPNAIKDTLTKKFGVDTTRNADGSLTEEEQIKRFGYTGDSSTIGSYTRATVNLNQYDRSATLNTGGQYAIVDVVSGDRVVSQAIYDPNGRFLKSVNPRLTEPGANTDTLGTLISIQQQRHGTASERIEGLTFDYNSTKNRTLASFAQMDLNVDPSKVNSAVQNIAREIMSIKAGTTREFMRDILDPVDSLYRRQNGNVSLRNYDALISADNTLQAAAASSAQILTSIRPFGVETFTEGQFAEYYDAGGIQTSNGFTIKYVRDENYTERGGYAGRLTIISPFGNQLGGLDDIGGPWGSPLDLIKAQYTYGFGSIDSGEFSNYLSDKLFRSDPKENAALIRNLVNAADYMTNANLSIDYSQPNLNIDFGWAPGGYLRSQWDQSAKERAAANQAAVDAERAARTSGQVTQDTQATPPDGTPPVGDQTYPQYTAPEGLGGGEQYTGTGSATGADTGAGVTTGGYQGATQESIQAGQQMYGTLPFQYTPTSTYTVGDGGVTGLTQQQPAKQYTVRQFRNASGLSTSITFVDGNPTSPIPSGFYPVDSQPSGIGVQAPTVQAPTFAETAMPQASQQAATGQAQIVPVPASSQIVPFEVQQQQAQQAIGTPSGYMPNYTGQTTTYQMATGGSVPTQTTATSTQPIGEFAGFRPEALQRIANTIGYQGDMNGFNSYLQNNPAANERMAYFTNVARKMAKGGLLKAQDGVDTTGAVESGNATKVMPTALNQQYIPQQNFPTGATLPQVQAEIAKTPGLPTGATVVPVGTTLEAGQLVSPYSGQVSGSVALPTAQAATTAAAMPTQQQATLTSAIEATPAVNSALQSLQAAQGTIDPRAQVLAAQQTASSVGDLQAAQGNAILMDNPIQRQIQDGELISGVANAETASAYTEQLQAAQATPSEQATVQGQLEGLMAQFEGGNTPAWAAGSMRKAMSTLAARGLGASSMAGQAVIQAAMEAALPIAQIDAATQSQFEQMNLSNRQQRVMLAAQQRAAFLGIEFDQAFQARVANAAKISDIANTNFTTEVQVALENSRIANTMNLQNLNNKQALVMAEAAALSQLDMQNLNNRQQAAVQNAQNFLTMDMANLSNQQQTDLFKAQQRVQSLFTDQAAQNAAQQFNASSENQVNQFFASLAQQTAQFNATQANAQAQFNAGQINTIERFNAEINNQRDQFNAQNRLIIDQSNAQWRREIATADSAAVNRANELNATALIGLSQSAYNNLWQYYRDNMEWAWTSAENERQRITNIAIAQLQADSSKSIQEMKQDYQSSANMGAAVFKVLTSDLSGSILGGLFG